MKMKYKDITKEDVINAKMHLSYDKETGLFTWINPPSKRVKQGDIAGCIRNGYVGININGERYQAHRLAIAFVDGSLSGYVEIDHDDMIRSNNRYSNLKKGTRTENMHNLGVRINNKTGYRGIHFHKGKYDASITVNSKKIHVGRFDGFDLALSARLEAEKIYY